MTESPNVDVVIEGGYHSPRSPSGWKKIKNCPGSIAMEAHFEDATSEFAAEGTAAHWVREQCLLNDKDVHEYIGTTFLVEGYFIEAKPDWVRFLQPGIDRIREEGGRRFIEKRCDLGAWAPGESGSVDCGIVLPDLIIVDDLKFGRGVIVDAEHNGQLMQYALGFWDQIARHETDATDFLLRIDQPRAGGGSEWRCTLDDLLRFAEDEWLPALYESRQPDAPLRASVDGCQFCLAAANGGCPELHRFVQELTGLDPDQTDLSQEPEMPDVDQLSPERRSYIVQHAKMVEKWLKSIHGVHLSKALAGEETPGFKAVRTEGNRAWRDEQEAEEFFTGRVPKKEMYSQKLKGPAQMEMVAGTRIWAKAQELIVRPEGPAALVPESDKRPALIPVVDLLDDLDDDDDLLGASPAADDDYDDLI